ncbi:MAG: NADH-quinone oxidoreductase subunit NuoE [Rickettsiales bacterium]|jgi:NADH-quinone oxidoreductase E subunit|nr:NADH-quinone oxidoreductase subunit NuoE [Rickettsiales bacterium]
MANQEFSFTKENLAKANAQFKKYPDDKRRSNVKAVLYLAQEQNAGWLSLEAMNYVAEFIGIAPIKVYEVATFYTMFNLKPIGKYFVKICRTTPCMLRGSDDLIAHCLKKLGVKIGKTTLDKLFTIKEVECLGACANAPAAQINNDYYEDLTIETLENILTKLAAGEPIKTGSQIGRISSEPLGEVA